jgi:hypothetical protein
MYSPSLALSNIPKILSSVDFPDPEDPMIATNSPSSTLKLIPFRTCNEDEPILYDL